MDQTLPVLKLTAGSYPSGQVLEQWDCPCCTNTVPIVIKPGRPRVYCSQACRQRAYRWRLRHRARTTATTDRPAERAHSTYGGDRVGHTHALRNPRDFMARRRDTHGREVTVCGVLARPARSMNTRHANFVFDGVAPCRACVELVSRPYVTDGFDST